MFLLCWVYYAKASTEFVISHTPLLRPGYTVPFEVISQKWQAFGNSVSNSLTRDLNLRLSASETNALPSDQLASTSKSNFLQFLVFLKLTAGLVG